jgi:sugar phosphate isomerase/epimerase
MDKHWANYCKMSIVHFMAFPETGGGQGSIVKSMARIAEDDFFDAIEIAPIQDSTTRTEVRRMLEVSQLQIGFCAHPTILSQKLNLNSLDADERRKAIRMMFELMDQGVELGSQSFTFLSGKDPGIGDRQAALDVLVDSINQLCAYGERSGLGLNLETFDRQVDKKALIGPVQDALYVAKAVRKEHPGFGLLYDLSHMPLLDESPMDMSLIREYLTHIHVGNCVKVAGISLYGDLHPYFGYPGSVNGYFELAEFVRALFKIGYLREAKDPKPWIGFEVKPQAPDQTSEMVIANAKRTWRQAWAMV